MSGSGFWQQLEGGEVGESVSLERALAEIPWNADGLIPAIAQQFETGEVLMLAWMNREALQETLEKGRVCYWSRSRQQLWRKGESSGQVQELREARLDCDGDTLLLLVDQTGPACHTGRRGCFYNLVQGDRLVVDKPVLIDPASLYGK
jgi:phosphoribosyl-AMP cyclohydrolase